MNALEESARARLNALLEAEGLPIVGEEVPEELAERVAPDPTGREPGDRDFLKEGRNRAGELTLAGSVERATRLQEVFENLAAPQEFAGFTIPGAGGPHASCMAWMPATSCPSCGFIGSVSGTCRRAECPRCSSRWRFNRVESILERVISFEATFHGSRVLHCVTSFEKDLELQGLFERSRELARSKGMWGAVEFFHPFRLRRSREAQDCPVKEGSPACGECSDREGCPYAELKGRAREVLEWSPGEFGLWRALVLLIQKGEADLQDFAYWSPHVHHFGVGRWTEKAEEGDPGVWKVISELESGEDLLKCSMYLLSHLGLEVPDEGKRSPSIRWSGALSAANWSLSRAAPAVQDLTRRRVDKLLSRREELEAGDVEGQVRDGCGCPECGGTDMIPLWRVDRSELPPGELRVLQVVDRVRYGELRVPAGVSSQGALYKWLREVAGVD